MDQLKVLAYEGLIRRFAYSYRYFPFMLKGSFLTRQYFPPHIQRILIDLDWICLKPLADTNRVQSHLNEWMHYLTTVQLDDGIRYQHFAVDSYWWELDYVMSEDFPTVCTAFDAWVNDQKVLIEIDVSFNLDVKDIQFDLDYQPFEGKSFKLAQTPSLATQIAWKLHQCMVNPRYKDIFDLTWLLQSPKFVQSLDTKVMTIEILETECQKDQITLSKYLGKDKLILAEARRNLAESWATEKQYFNFTESTYIAQKFEDFWNQFTYALITSELLEFII